MNKIRDKFYNICYFISNMPNTKINLLLGDIIEIDAPSNENLHKEIFMITYIDNDVITIKNDKKQFNLGVENNLFNDKSIKEINILHRREELGFAKQN